MSTEYKQRMDQSPSGTPTVVEEEGRAGGAGTTLALEKVIARALVDCEFRDRLFSDRDSVVEEYDLSQTDVMALSLLSRGSFDLTQEVAFIVGATC